MIHLSVKAFIRFFTEKMGQFPAQQGGELGAQRVSDISSDHLEGLVGWHLNLLEYLHYFRYTVFKFHECVSFLYKLMCRSQTVSRATGTFF
jgi:hypothetical protein